MTTLPLQFCLVQAMLLCSTVTSLGSPDRGQRSQPGAFCIPDGWQSGRAVTLAVSKNMTKPNITRVMGDVIYSTSLKKILVDENVFDTDQRRVTKIYDYPGHILYTVRGFDANRTCTKTALPGPFTPLCVPADARMTHYKSYYGVTQPYVEFFTEFQGKQDDVNYRVSLSYDVTPLFLQQWGKQDGDLFFRTEEFYNTTVWGNIPADIFKPPAICDASVLQTSVRNEASKEEEFDLICCPVLVPPRPGQSIKIQDKGYCICQSVMNKCIYAQAFSLPSVVFSVPLTLDLTC